VKLKRILAVPFAVCADVVTLGNMGDRSFTQQVFDAERRERLLKEELALIRAMSDLARSLKAPQS
jgi:hypothetical protein